MIPRPEPDHGHEVLHEVLYDARFLLDRHPLLLETLELPFEAWVLNLPAGNHLKPEYLTINPRGTIPTLVPDEGPALTGFRSIALWLAERRGH